MSKYTFDHLLHWSNSCHSLAHHRLMDWVQQDNTLRRAVQTDRQQCVGDSGGACHDI